MINNSEATKVVACFIITPHDRKKLKESATGDEDVYVGLVVKFILARLMQLAEIKPIPFGYIQLSFETGRNVHDDLGETARNNARREFDLVEQKFEQLLGNRASDDLLHPDDLDPDQLDM